MAEPQGTVQTPPPPSSNTPKINFGQVIDVPNSYSNGWTVRGMDPYTGRVMLNKRDGENVATRSISLEEYKEAQEYLSKSSKAPTKAPAFGFRLRQRLVSPGLNAQIQEFDGKTNTVLVDAVVGDDHTRTWVKRDTVEALAKKPTEEAAKKFIAEVTSKEQEHTQNEIADQTEGGEQSTQKKAMDEHDNETPDEVAPAESVGATRKAMRAKKLKIATALTLQQGIQQGTLKKATVDQAVSDIDERIARLQGRKKTAKGSANAEELATLKETRKELTIVSKYADTVDQVNTQKTALAKARSAGTGQRVATLNAQITKLQGSLPSLQTKALSASGKIEVALPAMAAAKGEIQATIPAPPSTEVQVSGKLPGTSTPTMSISTSGGGGARDAVGIVAGAALTATAPKQLAIQAGAAIQGLNTVINKREQSLGNVKKQIRELGNQYSQLQSSRQEAVQQGDTEGIGEIDRSLEGLSTARADLQDQQLSMTVSLSNAKQKQQKLQTLATNVSSAGNNAPAELVNKLRAEIPQSIELEIEATPEAPSPTAELARRSYATSLPSHTPPKATSRASRTRNRLIGQGIPLQTASAAALAGDAPDTRSPSGGYSENAGTDAYEQALSHEGGSDRIKRAPSYTSVSSPSTDEEDEDIFQGGQQKEQEMRAIEAGQREARESLLPNSGIEDTAEATPQGQEAAQEPVPRSSGTPRADQDTSSQLARARFRDMARMAKQRAMQQGLGALQGKAGALQGKAGGDSSNLQGIRRLKKMWDIVKVGTGLTAVGIVVTVITMNIQMINKLFPKSKIIPKQSMVEDMVTVLVDINMFISAFLPIFTVLILVIIVVVAAATIMSLPGMIFSGSFTT